MKSLIRDCIFCAITNRGKVETGTRLNPPKSSFHRTIEVSQTRLKSLQKQTEIPLHKINKQDYEKGKRMCSAKER